MTAVVEAFRPMVKNTLRGLCRIRFPSGLVMDEIALHVGSDDGRAWASPPVRPMADRDGPVMCDPRTGIVRVQPRAVDVWALSDIAGLRYPGRPRR